MFFKVIKIGTLVASGALLTGGLIFGNELASYARSSARSLQHAVKDKVPVEFEIRRARDLLDEIGPEIHNSVRAIAEQEVETGMLKRDIDESRLAIADERGRVQKLRDAVDSRQTSFAFGDMTFSRNQVAQELSRRFSRLKEAETALTSKQALLENRQKSLLAAQEALENAKAQRATLESQIEGLQAQYQLVQAASQASPTPSQLDHSKLAQAKQVMQNVRRQLEVAERVMAHEAKFTPGLLAEPLDEKDLVAQVDSHLRSGAAVASSTAQKTPASDAEVSVSTKP